MSWDFKNNPLLRTLLVVVIGILAFGLLFNSFTGGEEAMGGEHMGNTGNMAMNGGYGNSLGGLVGVLLALLVKILMIVLVVAIVVGIIVWIRNTFFQNTNSKFVQSIKNDPLLKTISVVTLAIIGIVFIFALLGSFSQSGMGYGSNIGNFNFGVSIAGLLTLLAKVLMFVLVVSLILATATYLKKQYDQGNLNFLGTNKNQGTNPGGTADSSNQQPTENAGTVNTTE